jgi:hypothetical protein
LSPAISPSANSRLSSVMPKNEDPPAPSPAPPLAIHRDRQRQLRFKSRARSPQARCLAATLGLACYARRKGKNSPLYCGPVLRHAAEPTQAANCRSSTAS